MHVTCIANMGDFIAYPKGIVKDGTRCQYGQVTNKDICIGGKCVVRQCNLSHNSALPMAYSSKII